MSTKFYVYGGGRWRELDVNTGRVSGWAKTARLVVARRGRLDCPRAGPVLRALRALAAGEPSRARDGPRVPHKRWKEEPPQSQQRDHGSPCQHCCHHGNKEVIQNMCKSLPQIILTRAPLAQPLTRQPPASTHTLPAVDIFDKLQNECVKEEPSSSRDHKPSSRKRVIRSSVSQERLYSSKRPQKRQRVASDTSVEFVSEKVINDNSPQRVEIKKHGRAETSEKRPRRNGRPLRRGSDNSLGIVKSPIQESSLYAEAPSCITPNKQKSTSTPKNARTARHNGDIPRTLRLMKPRNIPEEAKNSTAHNTDSESIAHNTDSESIAHNTDSESITTIDQIDADGVQDRSEIRNDEERSNQVKDASIKFAYSLYSDRQGAANKQSTPEPTAAGSAEVCKELVIEESDVVALRGFLRRCAPSVSLRRFDTDDDYKRSIFYRINPLVSLERNERIQRLLCGGDDISLRDFASQLGLRSVSDEQVPSQASTNSPVPKPVRMRKQPERYTELSTQPITPPSKKPTEPIKITTRENDMPKPSTSSKKSFQKIGVLKSPGAKRNTTRGNGIMQPIAATTTSVREDDVSLTSAPLVTAPKSKALPQPQSQASQLHTQPHRISKTDIPARDKGGKEYSRLEDQAIVSWVSGDGRARLVNGNRVWRELQDQYEGLTGQGRTWQSLRNRYLRYILPTLSSLAVSPSHAARLRASAASGEIKSKRLPARRNSIFATPGVRGAWSRRPRPHPAPHTPSPPPPQDESGKKPIPATETLKRSQSSPSSSSSLTSATSSSSSSAFVAGPKLRYSEVTRRFARRQAARKSTDSAASSVASPPRAPSPPRSARHSARGRRLFNPKSML